MFWGLLSFVRSNVTVFPAHKRETSKLCFDAMSLLSLLMLLMLLMVLLRPLVLLMLLVLCVLCDFVANVRANGALLCSALLLFESFGGEPASGSLSRCLSRTACGLAWRRGGDATRK